MPCLIQPLDIVRTGEVPLSVSFIPSENQDEGTFVGKNSSVNSYIPRIEQPWHIKAAQLLAKGWSNKEAASFIGKSPVEIGAALRTEWFQEKVIELSKIEEKSSVMQLIKAAQMSAVTKLVELTEDPKASKAVQLAAIKELLDRGQGKAVQHIEVKSEHSSSNPVADVEALEREVKSRLESMGQLKLLQEAVPNIA